MRKISKGHYTTTHENIQFDIINVKELHGNCQWSIEFIEYELGCEIFEKTGCDQLYLTKTEALDMAKYMINEYILQGIWNSEMHGY